ncbi:MAG: cold-shock protein [Gammaproteobacteria bacterium]|jgi:CspA family cold shock protein|tara:strand:- start:765 stop:971 length:207 start_codon:yes stop_codon:yes gene_type:complete
MVTGTVKFFNTSKGYGFIQPEEGGTDVFVHMTALDKAGIGTLKEGQRVQFDVVKGQNGKEAADNLSIA